MKYGFKGSRFRGSEVQGSKVQGSRFGVWELRDRHSAFGIRF